MSELPNGWLKTTVGNLFSVTGGGTPSTAISEYWTGNIPWISSADINENHQLSVHRYVTPEAIKNSAASVVPAGSVIVVTRVGLGKVAISDTPLSFSQDHQALLIPDEILNPRYVLLFMSTAVKHFKHLARGTTIAGVTKKQLIETEFVLPPRPEQDRIVAEIEKQFSRLDAATAALKRVRVNLKRYRASVLKAACEGRLVPTEAELARKEGREYEPADKLLERILRERRARWEVDTLAKMIASGKPPMDDRWKEKYKEPSAPDTTGLPDLPEGWCWANLEQLKSYSIYGPRFSSSRYSKGDIVVLRTTDISQTGKVDVSEAPHLDLTDEEFDRFQLRQWDLVFTRTGATVGKVAIFDDVIKAIPGAYLIHYRLILAQHLPWYVYRFFQSDRGQQALTRGTRGIGQPNLNAPTIEAITIPLPPINEQARIQGKIDEVLETLDHLTNILLTESTRSGSLRRSILQAAFSGNLIPQDPTDEPASVLLERIRAERAVSKPKPPTRRRPSRELACV